MTDWYQLGLRIYAYFPVISALLFFIDAPHGRFHPSNTEPEITTGWLKSLWKSTNMTVNGQWGWIIMELPAPIVFCGVFWNETHTKRQMISDFRSPSSLLAGLYVMHYINRALISPLRTTSRSPSHLAVFVMAILFNILNASLIGEYIGALNNAPDPLIGTLPHLPAFLSGLFLFVAGFISNVWHDEVLLRLRKTRDSSSQGRYKIPHGGLYRFISFPNYLSEWLEWTGYAIATTSLATLVSPSYIKPYGLGLRGWYTPPWMFVAAEIAVMLPRAIRGHHWYLTRFGEKYPPGRKAVIPFLL